MQNACLLIWLTGMYPLWRALQANRQTSLRQAIYWAIAAWTAWGLMIANAARWPSLAATGSCLLALSLTGCAAVAVLGARRPGMRAWNGVVAALLAVNLLPLAESVLTAGLLQLNVFRLVCLAGALTVGVLNYLPTHFAPAAVALLFGCAAELASLVLSARAGQEYRLVFEAGWIALVFTPWIAYLSGRRATGSAHPLWAARVEYNPWHPAASEFDRLWLDFRDRFGLVWAQRVREQFNRSAANAGWFVVLRWQGLRLLPGSRRPEPAAQTAMVDTLRALLKRFGPEDARRSPERQEKPP